MVSVTRYTVPVWGITANAFGLNPWRGLKVACSFGARAGQPELTVPLHVLVSITDSVPSPWLIANTVCRAPATAVNWGCAPVVTVGGVRPQPAVVVALHRAPLITDTVPSLLFAT